MNLYSSWCQLIPNHGWQAVKSCIILLLGDLIHGDIIFYTI